MSPSRRILPAEDGPVISLIVDNDLNEEGHEVKSFRLALPEYQDQGVELRFIRDAEGIRFLFCDQGDVADWRAPPCFSPERASDLHGRGIAMASKLSFEPLDCLGTGNTVLAVIRWLGTENQDVPPTSQ